MVFVRRESVEDITAIREINELAFGQPAEANLVDTLRSRGKALISLVAVEGDRTVGHILFSAVTIVPEGKKLNGIGLAPMSVLPGVQRQGVGSQLVKAGLEECRAAGFDYVVVLGHADYYPRFGFVPASRFGLKCEFDVPDEVFMAQELKAGALNGITGLVKYQPELDEF
jgi:putative acetyltransferase